MTALLAARSVLVALAGFALGLLLAAIAVPMAARAAPPPAAPPAAPDGESRVISIIVFGSDPCPPGKGDEIVVCARQPESERYRIPKRFREKKQDSAPNNSWANKTRSLDEASRTSAGIPDTCSAVGTGGQSGCYSQFLARSGAQRRQQQDEQQDDPSNPANVTP